MSEKSFPSSVQAERSLLGCLMLDPTLVQKVKDVLNPEDFYAGAHRRIFEMLLRMHESGDAIDILTVTERLRWRRIRSGASRQSANNTELRELRDDHPLQRRPAHAGHGVQEAGDLGPQR